MSALINNLDLFDPLLNKKIISNYENIKGFMFGSFEEHIMKLIFNSNQRGYGSYNQSLNESLLEFNKILNTPSEQFKEIKLLSIDRMKDPVLTQENIIDIPSMIIEELFSYAESLGIDVSNQRKESISIFEKLQKEQDKVDVYFNQLEKLVFLSKKIAVCKHASKDLTKLENHLKMGRDFLNDNETILLTTDMSSESSYLSSGSDIAKNFGELFKMKQQLIQKIKTECTDNMGLTTADIYLRYQNNMTPLQKAIFEKSTVVHIELTKSQDVSGAILFEDGSTLFREKDGNYIIKDTHTDVNRTVKNLSECCLDFMLRKKPQLAKVFKTKFEEDSPKIKTMLNVVDRFLSSEDILKSALKENYGTFLKEMFVYRSIEALDDYVAKVVDDHKFNQFAYSIASSKYKHLYDDKSLTLLKEIYDNKIDAVQLQDYIGKKIAAFKNSDDFNNILTQFVSKMNGFDIDTITDKVERLGATIVSADDGVLIVETSDYKQMQELGSTSWCIVRDEGFYEDYAGGGNRQYIVFDFNELSSNNNSMIGITLNEDGKHRNSHIKNDDSVYAEDVEKFHHIIIKQQVNTFKNLNENLRKEIFPNDTKINKLKMA